MFCIKKVIFLDIDGVLNCMPYFEEIKKGKRKDEGEISGEYIMRLKEAVEKTEAVLVLSSTWKRLKNIPVGEGGEMYQYLLKRLNDYGLSLYAETEEAEGTWNRPLEVKTWIQKHAPEARFVSIDDDFSLEEYEKYGIGDCLIKTNFFCHNTAEGGIQDFHVQEICKKLC